MLYNLLTKENIMTDKLYFLQPHLKDFSATVISCTPAENGLYALLLDRTAFFPEGGGQDSDEGYFTFGGEEIKVVSLADKGDEVVHYVKAPLTEGSIIEGHIDYELRFSRMQNHSGEHILSGIAHSLYGCNNVGFHMGKDEITLDFDIELSREQIDSLEALANRAVYQNVPFITLFPSEEELKELDYRSKKELSGRVRLVSVGGYDLCACCAPHVELSGEIGLIKIIGFIRYKGGVRLSILCGADAFAHYRHSHESIKGISVLLSAKHHEALPAVERLNTELSAAKAEASSIRSAYARLLLSSLKEVDGNHVIFDDILDTAARRALANGGAALCSGICAVFAKSGNGYTYVMASTRLDLKALACEINAALGGRGGGSASMITGSVSADREKIKEYFKA